MDSNAVGIPAVANPTNASHLNIGFQIWGGIAILGSAILAGRLIWEQTLLTWRNGPQMVGFSLAHGPYALLLLFPLLLIVWLFVVGVMSIVQALRRRKIRWQRWVFLGLALSVFACLFIPYDFWQWLFVGRIAKSPKAAEFLIYAAVAGNLTLVQALVSNGVSVDAVDREGKTALHGAAAGGDVKVVEFLLSKNANPNTVDKFGDSPLEVAASGKREAVAKFLAEHGAVRLRGSEEQRQKAIEEIVHKDIEEMDRRRRETP